MIGYWATLSLNMPDFTRYGRSQREQIVGQVVALPTTMTVFAAMGVHHHQRDGDHLRRRPSGIRCTWSASSRRRSSWPISMFTAVVATLAVNIAANVVSPANDFANAFPRLISFKTGGLITGLLGIVDAAVAAAGRSHRATSSPGCSATRAASARSPAC